MGCAAPGSKCCKSSLVEKCRWYPVSKDTECSFTGGSTTCWNQNGTKFLCAGGDRRCGDVCVARGDVCCENVNGHFFPCQGGGGQCCGNTCAAPGSKCCKSSLVEKSRWYPVSKDTECSFTGGSTTCWNRNGTKFLCAGGDRCCGDVCVARGDVCCENVNGHFFPCQGGGGQCCGNACAAPGSKCCKSSLIEKSRWYPVSKDT